MCAGSAPSPPEQKKIPEPAPAPPPPEPVAEAPTTPEGAGRTAEKDSKNAKRRGTQSLRIDLNLAQPGGNGLNIPRG